MKYKYNFSAEYNKTRVKISHLTMSHSVTHDECAHFLYIDTFSIEIFEIQVLKL